MQKIDIKRIIRENISRFINNDINSVDVFLNSLTESDRKNLEIEYAWIAKAATYKDPLTIAMFQHPKSRILESLTFTFPIDKTISHIKNYFDMDDRQIKKAKSVNGEDHILVFVPNIGDNISEVVRAMKYCGFFLSQPKTVDNIPDKPWVKLQFEKEFQDDVNKELRETEYYLYHLTPYYNVNKINKIGFCPKTKNNLFDYPDRVYFLKGSCSREEIEYIGKSLNSLNDSKANDGKYALFVIELSRVPETVNFYIDPNFPNSIYTKRNISPNTIIGMEEMQF